MLVRVAASHIRFGHFEHFSHRGELSQLQRLLDYSINHHFPELGDASDREAAFFAEVCRRTGSLIAGWQAYGFAHGVMNTDNMSILGITFDFGPYAFLDSYNPGLVCNHSDHTGRYAFHRQPSIGLWNLQCLGLALAPLIGDDAVRAGLAEYEPALLAHYREVMRQRLGLASWQAGDGELLSALLGLLASEQADYALSLQRLASVDKDGGAAWADCFVDRQRAREWLVRYRERVAAEDGALRAQLLGRANPQRLLRNYLAELAIRAAHRGDFTEVQRLFAALSEPFGERPQWAAYNEPPPEWGRQLLISCSS